MHLLLICPSWGRRCGIASYTRNLRGGFSTLGVTSDVATHPKTIGTYLAERAYDGILLQHEYSLYYFNLVQVLRLLEPVASPLIITMHNTDQSGWMGAQHLFLFRTRARFVVHSEVARRNLLSGAVRPARSSLAVIPMGCPDYRAQFGDRSQTRAELGLPDGRFVVGFFGFAARHKNIPNIVEAVRKVPDALGYISATPHPVNPRAVDHIYVACGLSRGDPMRNAVDNVILVHEPVPDEDLGRYQHAVDLIVLPYSEHGTSVSTSMMAHEAIAARQAVVTTRAVYFADLSDEVLKIPDPRPDTIAAAIRLLRNNSGEREALVERAARYVEENAWDRTAERYLNLLMKPNWEG
ncbi:MAG: glycosyltransferase [Bacillota bacterium]